MDRSKRIFDMILFRETYPEKYWKLFGMYLDWWRIECVYDATCDNETYLMQDFQSKLFWELAHAEPVFDKNIMYECWSETDAGVF